MPTDTLPEQRTDNVRYSWMFCEVCETNYREFLIRFEDNSVFTLCHGCVVDLRDVMELFGLYCEIGPLPKR